jgi:hypothetical protein
MLPTLVGLPAFTQTEDPTMTLTGLLAPADAKACHVRQRASYVSNRKFGHHNHDLLKTAVATCCAARLIPPDE